MGAYCLGGCDPRSSNTLDSCVPAPVCQSKTYTFQNNDRITSKDKYLGDPSKTDWVMDGQALIYQNTALLTMAANTVGTVLATSTYMWYGNVKARFRTSRGKGVVTAFILLSDVKDEIDYEFVGVDLQTAQSNYYHQGITNCKSHLTSPHLSPPRPPFLPNPLIPFYADQNGANISLSDTYTNYHDYEIRWTPDSITWLVDGQVGRTKNRANTWNSTSNQYAFPQTPARVQLSIWPGGLPSNGQGTIDWAGGLIDWNNPDITRDGYYYAQFASVTVDCYNASTAPGTNSHKAYWYKDAAGTNDTVVDGDKNAVLKSLLGTGVNMDQDLPAGAAASSVATVPGNGNGTSPTGSDAHDNTTDTSSGSGSGAGGASDTAAASAPTGSGFSQGNSGTGTGSTPKSGAAKFGERGTSGLGGSVFAAIVAVGVLMLL